MPKLRLGINIDHVATVRNARGGLVPLPALAQIRLVQGPQTVVRYNGYRGAIVNGASKPGYSSGQVRAALEETFRESMPTGMGYSYQGMSYQEQRAAEGVPAAASMPLRK